MKFGSYDLPARPPKPPKVKPPKVATCPQCGVTFESAIAGRRICSAECRAERKRSAWKRDNEKRRGRASQTFERVCPHCGGAFETANPLQRYCSTKCGNRAAHGRRRAVEAGAYVEDVWRSKVYERDGYMCQLCHKPAKMTEVVPHPKAPTLDHVIPLAAGGTHEYANVQLAHFLCNSIKSAGAGQLRLNIRAVA